MQIVCVDAPVFQNQLLEVSRIRPVTQMNGVAVDAQVQLQRSLIIPNHQLADSLSQILALLEGCFAERAKDTYGRLLEVVVSKDQN